MDLKKTQQMPAGKPVVKKPVAALAPIIIPSKQTIEGSRVSLLKWLLYGPPGIGKSTFFSKASEPGRNPLFLYTDPGLRHIKALKSPILSWGAFKRYVHTLVATPPKHVSMIVLDTVDLLFRMCRREMCIGRGIEHISDEAYGKGYDLVRDEFEQEIIKLAKLDVHGIGLAFISHAKDVEIRGRSVRTSKIVPTLPKQAADIILPLCDVIGYAGFAVDSADGNKEGIGRLVHFEPDETLEAKDRTGLLPAKCKLDYGEVRQYLEGAADSPAAEAEQEEDVEVPARSKRR